MQSPKYQSYFIINKRREYQKTNLHNHSLQLPYRSGRQNLQSGKRLSVTSKCHRILWEKDKENNLVLGGVRTYLTGRKIAEQHVQLGNAQNGGRGYGRTLSSGKEEELRERSVSYENGSSIRLELQKGFNQITKSLYHKEEKYSIAESSVRIQTSEPQIQPITQLNQQKQTHNNNKEKQFTLNKQVKSQFNYPLSYKYNYDKLSSSNNSKMIKESIIDRTPLLEDSLHDKSLPQNSVPQEHDTPHDYPSLNLSSSYNPNMNLPINLLLTSQASSTKSRHKSKLLQYKEQFNSTLQKQEIIQSSVLKSHSQQQESELKSFTKDELCSSFYDGEEEHLPHRLILGSARRNHHNGGGQKKEGIKNVEKNNGYAMTVREHSVRGDERVHDVQSRSMKDNPIHERNSMKKEQLQEVRSGQELPHPENQLKPFNFTNILTHQSQLIKPSFKSSAFRHSEQIISVAGLNKNYDLTPSQHKPNNPLLDSQKEPNSVQFPEDQPTAIPSVFQKVLQLNPKPCQSFILETVQEPASSNFPQKSVSPSLQNFYQQQLKRRSQANEILKSLMNMKMIHEAMEA